MTSPDHNGKLLAWRGEDLISCAKLLKVIAVREKGKNLCDLRPESGYLNYHTAA